MEKKDREKRQKIVEESYFRYIGTGIYIGLVLEFADYSCYPHLSLVPENVGYAEKV